ncbi:MAG TPA: flagellar biosynthesis protein FlhB [Chromatiales bacterium]|nr:flagellar biosynthesis protein FlhB [Chromatiales bacterium]
MADNDQQFQERTERATPKRLEEARKRGQVPRSRELGMAAVMISASVVFLLLQSQLGGYMIEMLRDGLSIDPAALRDTDSMGRALTSTGLKTLAAFSPLLGTLMLSAIFGGAAIGGFSFSTSAMAPKLSKLNPLKGIKRVFGLKGLVEVAKALAKAGLVGGIGIAFIAWSADSLFHLGLEPLRSTMSHSGQMVFTMLLVCSSSLLLIALVDVPYQLWNHAKELRMTHKEIQDEAKETEGRPEVRSRIRSLQQEIASQRMLDDVPDADVVVTNPTHFAVALKYTEGQMGAPRVLAKGADHMAARIRAIAEENRITLFEAPPLARALYWTTEVGQEIPHQLYLAVAQVLTYVFRLKAAAENRGTWPDRPTIQVDAELTQGPLERKSYHHKTERE